MFYDDRDFLESKVESLEEEITRLENKVNHYESIKKLKRFEKILKYINSIYTVKIGDDKYSLVLKRPTFYTGILITKNELDEIHECKMLCINLCNEYYQTGSINRADIKRHKPLLIKYTALANCYRDGIRLILTKGM
jgi:negative regulator of genetic competence, sporulation and motility